MIGKTISHYKILSEIGSGGMGIVYKAEDTKLKRTVALKFLPPELTRDKEAKDRLLHEARAAAALEHTNICPVFEINETADGQMYMVMAFYEGETLREKIVSGPLPIAEVINIIYQIADGLNKAHEKGIIHRDIKPANIMIIDEEVPKILDFGLAKLRGQTKLTKESTTLGTIAYMSPEQTTGEEVDQRSDIWSLGVVFYEMLTGKLPFRGHYEQAIMYSIMNEDPEPIKELIPDLPIQLEQIINKMLAKDPAERYQSCSELIVDSKRSKKPLESPEDLKASKTFEKKRTHFPLKKVIVPLALTLVVLLAIFLGKELFLAEKESKIESIAVLPLGNLSGDPEQEYFVDGMTDELIATLGKLGVIRVISRQSVMRYKGSDKSLPQIAEELDVDAVVEGTVLRSKDKVRITVQLIDGKTDRHLWAESYVRDLHDVLIMQSEVARNIAREIKIKLNAGHERRLSSVPKVNSKAFDFYLQGRYHFIKWNLKASEKAVQYFTKAIEADPNYALAYVGLANAYGALKFYGGIPYEEAYLKCTELLKKAFKIDETLPEAHMTLASLKFYDEWDWAGAEKGFKRALELNPNLVGNNEYAWYLASMGRVDQAITEAKRTLRLDPYAYFTNQTLAHMYSYAGQRNQAIAQWQKIIELDLDGLRAYNALTIIYASSGKYDDALKNRRKLMTLLGAPAEKIAELERIYSQSGSRGYWNYYLKRVKSLTFKASIYLRLNDKNQALNMLEKAYDEHSPQLVQSIQSSNWDPLRADPRFKDLLRRMKFPEKGPVKTNSKKEDK